MPFLKGKSITWLKLMGAGAMRITKAMSKSRGGEQEMTKVCKKCRTRYDSDSRLGQCPHGKKKE